MWHDPLQEIYYKLDVLANKTRILKFVKKEILIMTVFATIGTDSLILLQEQEWTVQV
jgi:hypothetical protein